MYTIYLLEKKELKSQPIDNNEKNNTFIIITRAKKYII